MALGDSTCVSLPPSAPTWLHDLQRRDLDADLTDPATVARVIGPVQEFLGPATLAFLDPTAVDIRDDPRVASVPAGHESVRHLAATCGPQDAQESGILAVGSSLAVWQDPGRVVAASGYQVCMASWATCRCWSTRPSGVAALERRWPPWRSTRWSTPAWCHNGGPAARWWRRARSPAHLDLWNWVVRRPTRLPPHGEASLRSRRQRRARCRPSHVDVSKQRSVRWPAAGRVLVKRDPGMRPNSPGGCTPPAPPAFLVRRPAQRPARRPAPGRRPGGPGSHARSRLAAIPLP